MRRRGRSSSSAATATTPSLSTMSPDTGDTAIANASRLGRYAAAIVASDNAVHTARSSTCATTRRTHGCTRAGLRFAFGLDDSELDPAIESRAAASDNVRSSSASMHRIGRRDRGKAEKVDDVLAQTAEPMAASTM